MYHYSKLFHSQLKMCNACSLPNVSKANVLMVSTNESKQSSNFLHLNNIFTELTVFMKNSIENLFKKLLGTHFIMKKSFGAQNYGIFRWNVLWYKGEAFYFTRITLCFDEANCLNDERKMYFIHLTIAGNQ